MTVTWKPGEDYPCGAKGVQLDPAEAEHLPDGSLKWQIEKRVNRKGNRGKLVQTWIDVEDFENLKLMAKRERLTIAVYLRRLIAKNLNTGGWI